MLKKSDISNNQTDLAEEVFGFADWQHIDSILEDWRVNGEPDTCEQCGKMFKCYGVNKCPYCGAENSRGD